jgi:hypothetical protein
MARDSVKEVVFDVGHLELVKERLRGLLRSEIVPISEMCHGGEIQEKSMDEEGIMSCLFFLFTFIDRTFHSSATVTCNVGNWVQVECNYSPGNCSEGETAVVIAKVEGEFVRLEIIRKEKDSKFTFLFCIGLATVKYIYGPTSPGNKQDDVIGSSLQGKLETGVTLGRLTTIIMPMRGESILYEYTLID